jgi:UDP-3-O-[3-hydroxymyristoyl] glucosamine N-acyltransferase
MKLADLAQRVGCELRGDGSVEVVRGAPIECAQSGDLSFVANPRYVRYLRTTCASAVVIATDAPEVPVPSLRTTNPQLAFAKAVELLYQPVTPPLGIHPTAVIAPSAEIGPGASIGAYAVVGDAVRIGSDARIAPHVVIYPEVVIGSRFTAHAQVTVRERVRIGDDVTLHAGVVIGSDGFGYVVDEEGHIRKMVQAGDVVLEDFVEIGANSTVDRAAVGSTVIRRGAKLDNLVMIAHGCEVGEYSMLAAQVGLAGSTRLGRLVRMGGQAGAAGHLSIGDGVQVAAQSGVPNSVPRGAVISGTPATDIARFRRVSAALGRLPSLLSRVRRLERLIGVENEPKNSR